MVLERHLFQKDIGGHWWAKGDGNSAASYPLPIRTWRWSENTCCSDLRKNLEKPLAIGSLFAKVVELIQHLLRKYLNKCLKRIEPLLSFNILSNFKLGIFKISSLVVLHLKGKYLF